MAGSRAKTQPDILRPTWIEINRNALERNLRKIRKVLKNDKIKILAVVKANAYGHGAVQTVKGLETAGADGFGVSCVEEAVILRKAGIHRPILILGNSYPFPETFQAALRHRLTLTLSSVAGAQAMANFMASRSGRIKVHLKMETGMQRIGARPETLERVMRILCAVKGVEVEGLYTHFASARNADFTNHQLSEFHRGANMLREKGFTFRMMHAANSAALLRYAQTHLDMVRPGIALYGGVEGFEPVASLKSRVIFIKKIAAGTTVSYERLFCACRDSWIATIPVGYADGLPITASRRAHVLVRGRRAPVAGLITMDMTMVDVTDLMPIEVGEPVTLLGMDGRENITAQDWAQWSKTSIYQFLCHLGGTRVPKFYRDS